MVVSPPVTHWPPYHNRKRPSATARATVNSRKKTPTTAARPPWQGSEYQSGSRGGGRSHRCGRRPGAARRAGRRCRRRGRPARRPPPHRRWETLPRASVLPPPQPLPSHPQRALRAQVGAALALGRLNHLAVAVPDLDASVALYRDVLGAEVSEPESLPEHGVTVVFINLPNTKIELLHPFGERSPIQGFLDKNPAGGMHHVCIEVADVTAAIAELKAKGIRVLSEEPKIGAHNKPVVFLHPKDCGGVLVELEEE